MVTTEAEVKGPSAEDPEVSKVSSLKPGVGQNIALHASPTVREAAFLTTAMQFLVYAASSLSPPPPNSF